MAYLFFDCMWRGGVWRLSCSCIVGGSLCRHLAHPGPCHYVVSFIFFIQVGVCLCHIALWRKCCCRERGEISGAPNQSGAVVSPRTCGELSLAVEEIVVASLVGGVPATSGNRKQSSTIPRPNGYAHAEAATPSTLCVIAAKRPTAIGTNQTSISPLPLRPCY